MEWLVELTPSPISQDPTSPGLNSPPKEPLVSEPEARLIENSTPPAIEGAERDVEKKRQPECTPSWSDETLNTNGDKNVKDNKDTLCKLIAERLLKNATKRKKKTKPNKRDCQQKKAVDIMIVASDNCRESLQEKPLRTKVSKLHKKPTSADKTSSSHKRNKGEKTLFKRLKTCTDEAKNEARKQQYRYLFGSSGSDGDDSCSPKQKSSAKNSPLSSASRNLPPKKRRDIKCDRRSSITVREDIHSLIPGPKDLNRKAFKRVGTETNGPVQLTPRPNIQNCTSPTHDPLLLTPVAIEPEARLTDSKLPAIEASDATAAAINGEAVITSGNDDEPATESATSERLPPALECGIAGSSIPVEIRPKRSSAFVRPDHQSVAKGNEPNTDDEPIQRVLSLKKSYGPNTLPSSIQFPDMKRSGASLRSQWMKLPKDVGKKSKEVIRQLLQELGIEAKPVPTEEICTHFNQLRSDLLLLHKLRTELSDCLPDLKQVLGFQNEEPKPDSRQPLSSASLSRLLLQVGQHSIDRETRLRSVANLICIVCQDQFTDSDVYRHHLQSHLRLGCGLCDYVAASFVLLEDHVKTIHRASESCGQMSGPGPTSHRKRDSISSNISEASLVLEKPRLSCNPPLDPLQPTPSPIPVSVNELDKEQVRKLGKSFVLLERDLTAELKCKQFDIHDHKREPSRKKKQRTRSKWKVPESEVKNLTVDMKESVILPSSPKRRSTRPHRYGVHGQPHKQLNVSSEEVGLHPEKLIDLTTSDISESSMSSFCSLQNPRLWSDTDFTSDISVVNAATRNLLRNDESTCTDAEDISEGQSVIDIGDLVVSPAMPLTFSGLVIENSTSLQFDSIESDLLNSLSGDLSEDLQRLVDDVIKELPEPGDPALSMPILTEDFPSQNGQI